MKAAYMKTRLTIQGVINVGVPSAWEKPIVIETLIPMMDMVTIESMMGYHLQDLVNDYIRGDNMTHVRERWFI